jgi:predicted RecA/RadA family phage recombinase
MKNFVQPGDTITLLAPYIVASGAGLLVGSIFGVASAAAASGAEVEAELTGVFDLPKVGSQAWTVGVRVYWDDTNKHLTSTASTHKLVGVAVAAVGSGAGETTGRVRLSGAFTL